MKKLFLIILLAANFVHAEKRFGSKNDLITIDKSQYSESMYGLISCLYIWGHSTLYTWSTQQLRQECQKALLLNKVTRVGIMRMSLDVYTGSMKEMKTPHASEMVSCLVHNSQKTALKLPDSEQQIVDDNMIWACEELSEPCAGHCPGIEQMQNRAHIIVSATKTLQLNARNFADDLIATKVDAEGNVQSFTRQLFRTWYDSVYQKLGGRPVD